MSEITTDDAGTGYPGEPSLIERIHNRLVFGRRTAVLTNHLVQLIPRSSRVLDVGCGDGTIDRMLIEKRPDISIVGIDTLVRQTTHIAVRQFDGAKFPHPDHSFDLVMFVDVLHHTVDPSILLREAVRTGRTVLIKDHFREGILASATLRLMDWVGNASHGVALPYNYWSKSEWSRALDSVGLRQIYLTSALGLYPAPFCWVFDRELHFIAHLEPRENV